MCLPTPSPTSFTSLHCQVCLRGRPCNHKSTYPEPAPLQLKVCLQMPQDLASSPSPHHYVSIYNQPLLLHKHLQPELTAECARSAGSGRRYCLPRTLATGPGDAAEDTTQDPPLSAALDKHHTVVDAVDPSGLSQKDIMSLWNQSCHIPLHLALSVTIPRVTACSRVPPPACEGPSGNNKASKCTATYMRLQKPRKIRETRYHQRNFQYLTTKQWRYMNCPTKNSKQLV